MAEENPYIDPEILASFGLFIIRFAFVERCLSDIFTKMTNGDPGIMEIVTSNVSQNTVAGWISTLINIRSAPEDFLIADELRDALKDCEELRNTRNAFAHGLWGTECAPGSALVQTVRLERATIILDEVVTASDLDHLVLDANEIARRLLDILKRM